MLFNSLTFIQFFAVVLLLHHMPFSWSAKKFNLLLASYLFYAAWNPPFVILIWISTLVDWFAAKGVARAAGHTARRAWLVASVASNLGLLGFFKYGGFLLDNFVALAQLAGIEYRPVAPDIVLPVGISFYTFQTLSYTIDVYRRNTPPARSFLDYALYVTFFPQLVAGPIVRSVDFLPQCVESRRANAAQFGWGFSLLLLGLFEKSVIADGLLAPVADKVYALSDLAAPADAWVGTLAFSGQIFCDFAGYSTCAIGVAMCLGFAIQDNFRFPYGAIGFSDFWRRWHISLSSWLRDYLYISLGGNRRGAARTYVNLSLTMLLGGLWHGAAWTFVAWGALHGMYLVLERLLQRLFGGMSLWGRWPVRVILAVATYLCVLAAWVFFRAQDGFGQAWTLLGRMAALPLESASPVLTSTMDVLAVLGITAAMLALHGFMREKTLESVAARVPWWLKSCALAGMLFAILTMSGDQRSFIYFQF